ncbi:hypothetical protein EV291_10730 [Rhizobium sp. BK068]|nr:hypothetical protein EV291_10730 [Rhizobium sp. BK068]
MKIAAAQTSVSPDITANGSAVRSMIAAAPASGVRVINFCEGSLAGYSKFQMLDPDDWRSFDWHKQEAELRAVADLCSDLRIFAVVGDAHRLAEATRRTIAFISSPTPGHFSPATTRGSCRTANLAGGILLAPHRSPSMLTAIDSVALSASNLRFLRCSRNMRISVSMPCSSPRRALPSISGLRSAHMRG